MTNDEKNKAIDQRLKQYDHQMFNLEIDRTAFVAVGDAGKIKEIDDRLEQLRKAYEAVEAMKEG